MAVQAPHAAAAPLWPLQAQQALQEALAEGSQTELQVVRGPLAVHQSLLTPAHPQLQQQLQP